MAGGESSPYLVAEGRSGGRIQFGKPGDPQSMVGCLEMHIPKVGSESVASLTRHLHTAVVISLRRNLRQNILRSTLLWTSLFSPHRGIAGAKFVGDLSKRRAVFSEGGCNGQSKTNLVRSCADFSQLLKLPGKLSDPA